MAHWLARLTGDGWELDQLSQMVRAPDLHVTKQDDGYYLQAAAFDNLTDAGGVHALAKEMMPLLNGAAKLHFGEITPIDTDAVMSVDEQGQRQVTVIAFADAGIRFRLRGSATATVIGPDGVPLPSPPSNIERWTTLGLQQVTVAHALRLLAYPLSWSNLHKLLEVVEQDVGGERELKARQWVPKAEIDRFTATANNYSVLGDEARHAHRKWQPPKNPMTFGAAKALIGTILEHWLREK